jgi:sulfite reductase alpha subunit-like flavoprotein
MEKEPAKLLILYATQTGNALDAAERIGREAERRGCAASVRSIDDFDAVSFLFLKKKNEFFLIAEKIRESMRKFEFFVS